MIDKIIPNNKLYIKKINNNKGWGVYASEEIKKDEIVEVCHCFMVSTNFNVTKEYTELMDYLFTPITPSANKTCLLPFGYGCIYNHSNDPNLKYTIDVYNKQIKFFAAKDIGIDDELCHNYGEGYLKRKPLI